MLKLPIYALLYLLSYPYFASFWLKFTPKQAPNGRTMG